MCEEIFGRKPELLKDASAREKLVDVCQRMRWMSVREVNEAFTRVGLEPAQVPTEARDLGRPAEPPMSTQANPGNRMISPNEQGRSGGGPPKVVIFCLDWSCSMMSRDTRTPLTRFETCVACIQRILQDQVRDCDSVGVVCFGPKVETIAPPTPKSVGGRQISSKISSLRPSSQGGTAFFDAVLDCLNMLDKGGAGQPPDAQKWLICLTDGDDLGSQRTNARGELVDKKLAASVSERLNMMMITVGALRAGNVLTINQWVERVAKAGGTGQQPLHCHGSGGRNYRRNTR